MATQFLTLFFLGLLTSPTSYALLAEAKQAAEEYRKEKILSHFNLEEQ